jgi:hypothetical protein
VIKPKKRGLIFGKLCFIKECQVRLHPDNGYAMEELIVLEANFLT